MSLFGIACSRQIGSKLLVNRPPEVTRSTVQKAVVVVTDSPQTVGQLREKLSVVTSAWFAQWYVRHGCTWSDVFSFQAEDHSVLKAPYLVAQWGSGADFELYLAAIFRILIF